MGQSPYAEESVERVAVVPVPTQFSRWVSLPADGGVRLARLEDVIAAHASAVFPGREVLATAVFRITRDADVEVGCDNRRPTCSMRWKKPCLIGGGGRLCG